MNILDIVKHAVKTIIHCLDKNDRLALIVYSTDARTVFSLKNMTEENKKSALKDVE